MINTLIAFSILFAAFWAALRLADRKLQQSRRRVSDDTPDIDRELALNAEIRRLQGNIRIGDIYTERFKTTDSAGIGRDAK